MKNLSLPPLYEGIVKALCIICQVESPTLTHHTESTITRVLTNKMFPELARVILHRKNLPILLTSRVNMSLLCLHCVFIHYVFSLCKKPSSIWIHYLSIYLCSSLAMFCADYAFIRNNFFVLSCMSTVATDQQSTNWLTGCTTLSYFLLHCFSSAYLLLAHGFSSSVYLALLLLLYCFSWFFSLIYSISCFS